jgi:pimeloyl-ACP methyl ester carboxylesterase
VLLLHGESDGIVPISHSRALAKVARDATLVEMAGGHNDFPHDWAGYWEQIDRFLATTSSP